MLLQNNNSASWRSAFGGSGNKKTGSSRALVQVARFTSQNWDIEEKVLEWVHMQ